MAGHAGVLADGDAGSVLVDQVRGFNRVVTQRVGALDDRYLGRARPLGQDRVLWEIGTEGCEVRALRSRLASTPDTSAGCCGRSSTTA